MTSTYYETPIAKKNPRIVKDKGESEKRRIRNRKRACTHSSMYLREKEKARGQMHAHRRAEMLRCFLAEGIACHGTWSALRNADEIRTTRVAKGKGKHRRCQGEKLEGKPLKKNEPRTLELGDRMKGGKSS